MGSGSFVFLRSSQPVGLRRFPFIFVLLSFQHPLYPCLFSKDREINSLLESCAIFPTLVEISGARRRMSDNGISVSVIRLVADRDNAISATERVNRVSYFLPLFRSVITVFLASALLFLRSLFLAKMNRSNFSQSVTGFHRSFVLRSAT